MDSISSPKPVLDITALTSRPGQVVDVLMWGKNLRCRRCGSKHGIAVLMGEKGEYGLDICLNCFAATEIPDPEHDGDKA